MATLNDKEFNIIKKITSVINNNIRSPLPGSDETIIKHNGYITSPMVITAFVYNEKEFDNFKEQFYTDDDLTLAIQEDGIQLIVRGGSGLHEIEGDDYQDITFMAQFDLKTPYKESIETIIRDKTITAHNQEWSSDDNGSNIKTEGNVVGLPNIQIIGGAAASSCNRDSGYEDTNTDVTVYSNSNTSFTLEKTHTFTANSHYGWILNTVGMDIESCSSTYTGYGKVTYQAASLNGGAETDVPGASWSQPNPGYDSKSVTDLDIQCAANENLVVRFYLKSSSGLACARIKNLDYDILASRKDVCKNPQVYNVADPTVKSSVANEVEPDMIVLINTDGTGTIEYADDFSTDKYLDALWSESGVTHDTVNDEVDIADDGYIIYKIDTKYPILNIPSLISTINISSGAPTIQISTDFVTWYDIDISIADGVETNYLLDSDSNLSLTGKSVFYFRFDCVKTGTTVCHIESIELNINIHSIYIKNPKIAKGSSASTFRIDQYSESGLACIVSLIYKNRWWL